MSPRIIQIPLSGGDRNAQAKGIRHAHGLHASSGYWRDWLKPENRCLVPFNSFAIAP